MENKEIHITPEIHINHEEIEIIGINTICRFCASQNERLIGVYSEEGISNDLATKINLYLPVKVNVNDELPLQCCWSCASTILAWHELVLTCVESDRKFRNSSFITEKQILGGVGYDNSVGAPSDENDGMEGASVTTSLNDFCQAEMPKKAPKPSKKKKKTEPPPTPHDNPLETYISDIEHHLIDPELVENPDLNEYKIDIENDQILDDEDNKIISDIDRKINDIKSFAVSVSVKSDRDDSDSYYACQYCPGIFVLKRDVINHVRNDHGKDFDISVVQQIPKQIPEQVIKKERRKNNKIDQDLINSAKVVVDGRIYYNCKECGKSLHSPYTYIWHMRIHTGERPFVCDLCGKQFRVSQGLVRHLRETHQGIKKFPCDLCGRMFATRRNVEEHRRIHTNERPYVCDLCGKSFKQKASLFVHKRSHRNYFPFKCSYCNQGFRTKPPLMVHITRHTGEKPYKCDVCGRCFRIKYELKRHRLIHSDEKPWVCNICGLSFRQKRYKDPAVKSEDDLPVLPPELSDEDEKKPLTIAKGPKLETCDICNKTFAKTCDLKRHNSRSHTAKDFDRFANLSTKTCTACCKSFPTRTLLKKHVQDAHNAKQKRHRRKNDEIEAHFFCDVCEKGFTRKYDMEKHKMRIHGDEQKSSDSARKTNMELLNKCRRRDSDGKAFYECDFCERVFAQSYNLMRHRTIHTGVKAFFCHICGKSFRMSNGLTRHIDTFHHGVRNFRCEVCGKCFTARATRDEHMNIHTNNRPFVCDICGKCFKQKASLHVHKIFHTDMYRFQCNTCEKKFRRAQDLKVHSWLHTGHRPYSCPQCKAAFRLGHDLKRHLRVHEKVNECVCNECGSIFSQERYLKVHKKIHRKNISIKLEDPLT